MNYGSNWPGETTALPVEEWGLWTQRASRLMDRLTLGRAAQHAEELAEPLGDACLQIAQLLSLRSTAQVNSRGGLLSGANNDGYSESYAAGNAVPVEREARAILAACLGEDRYGLLYRGVSPC